MRFSRKNYISEKNMIIGAVAIFFALIALLFILTSATRSEDNNMVNTASESRLPSPVYNDQPGPAMRVEDDQGNHTTVRYMNGSFTPRDVTVSGDPDCFIEIKNESDTTLTPRLGPYDPSKESGFLYTAIDPHASAVIDPRYGAIATLSFYNKHNPSAIFTVHLGLACL